MTNITHAREFDALDKVLRGRRQALVDEIHEDLLKTDEHRAALFADGVRDLVDESVADLIVDLDLADTDRDLEELRDVEAALARQSAGTYGRCTQCRQPIPHDRLAASPTAERCQPCQAMHEKTFAHKGMPGL